MTPAHHVKEPLTTVLHVLILYVLTMSQVVLQLATTSHLLAYVNTVVKDASLLMMEAVSTVKNTRIIVYHVMLTRFACSVRNIGRRMATTCVQCSNVSKDTMKSLMLLM